MIFEKKKTGTRQVVPNCSRIPIPKFHFELLLLTWHRASENVDCCTLKWVKKINLETFLEPAPWGGLSSLILLKAKNVSLAYTVLKVCGFSVIWYGV